MDNNMNEEVQEEVQEKLKKTRRLMNAPYIIALSTLVLLVLGFSGGVEIFLFLGVILLLFGYIPGFICISVARKRAKRLIADGVQEADAIQRKSRGAILFCALHLALMMWILMYFGSRF